MWASPSAGVVPSLPGPLEPWFNGGGFTPVGVTSGLSLRPGSMIEVWSTLADLLSDKYGPPKKTGTKLLWIFPTATI